MQYITLKEFLELFYSIHDSTDCKDLKNTIFIYFYRFSNRNYNFQYNITNEKHKRIIMDFFYHYDKHGEILKDTVYYENRKQINIDDILNYKIKFHNFYNCLVYLDEYFTHYNRKDDDENKRINEFLFIYREKIRKFLI